MSRRILPHAPLFALATVLLASVAFATTRTVDPGGGADHTSIQLALDAAAAGDTVLVAAATYSGTDNTNLDFAGEDIVLLSVEGAATTIIDGGGTSRAFTFQTQESELAVVDGFTVVDAPLGSAIRITSSSSPTIRNCVIQDNDVTTNAGAVFIQDSSPTFSGCSIVNNTNGDHGGGIYASGGAPTFTDCLIVGNATAGRGGAAWLTGGATVTFENCTISGNRANTGGDLYDGGGLMLTGSATADVSTSIVWGNYGALGDDLFLAAACTLTVDCSTVDSTGTSGGGVISYGPDNLYHEPHFCRPAYDRASPWEQGDYRLALNSPCLAANNTCGELMGAEDTACDSVLAWTGAALTTDWHTAGNWSTNRVPGAADHAQVTRGEVVLTGTAEVAVFTQSSESSVPDTFRMIAAEFIMCGDSSVSVNKGACQSSIFGNSSSSDSSDSKISALAKAGTALIISEYAYFHVRESTVDVGGDLEILGRIGVEGVASSSITATNIVQSGDGTYLLPGSGPAAAPTGLHVLQGTLQVSGDLANSGLVTVDGDASLDLAANFTNLDGGVLSLRGDLVGTGALMNQGTFRKVGTAASACSVAVDNQRAAGPGPVGTIEVTGGSLNSPDVVDNTGLVTVAGGAVLRIGGTLNNGPEGVVILGGDLLGSGTVVNRGLLAKPLTNTTSATPLVENRFDTASGVGGTIAIDGGVWNTADLVNSGTVTIATGTTLASTSTLTNNFAGLIDGTGTLDVSAATFVNYGTVGPGLSPGVLTFAGAYAAGPTGVLRMEVGGATPGTQHDRLAVVGTMESAGSLLVEMVDGFAASVGDSFALVMVDGIATGDFDCYAGLQVETDLYLAPLIETHRIVLAAQNLAFTGLPTAEPDTYATNWDTPLSLAPLANDTDPDGDPLRVIALDTSLLQGVAFMDSGATTVTYLPPSGYNGTDVFAYTATDCNGGNDVSEVVIIVDEVVDVPGSGAVVGRSRLHQNVPNPFNPVTRIRFDLATAGPASLAIYDVRGRRLRVLSVGQHAAGPHVRDWWGRDDQGRKVPSGVYFARLVATGVIEVRKMVLVH